VNSTCLITSELTNQSARKALFTGMSQFQTSNPVISVISLGFAYQLFTNGYYEIPLYRTIIFCLPWAQSTRERRFSWAKGSTSLNKKITQTAVINIWITPLLKRINCTAEHTFIRLLFITLVSGIIIIIRLLDQSRKTWKNAALFLRFGPPPSTLFPRHDWTGLFETLFRGEKFENAGFAFKLEPTTFW